jgi:putative transposase
VVVRFIDQERARFGVEPICRVLTEHGCKISPSGYYAYKRRPASMRSRRDGELLVLIRACWEGKGRRRYGSQKVWRQLRKDGVVVARCTVERLMRQAGLAGVSRGAKRRTTIADAAATRPPDLVKRDFRASRPNQLWVVDFTYVATHTGTAYTAFALDVYSRRIVGWRCASAMPAELPLDALEMAIDLRERTDQSLQGLVHHSDAGGQYTAIRYTQRLAEAGAIASIGTVGDSYDNALAEALIALYKAELVDFEGPWQNVAQLELATLTWVDWYNTTRLHGSINHTTPNDHEATYWKLINTN